MSAGFLRRETPSLVKRFPFARQPVHCMIVDLTSKFTNESLEVLCEGLSNVFCLICSLSSGSRRVPYFCLLAITPYIEVLFAAQHVNKASFSRIESSLQELRRTSHDCDQNAQNTYQTDAKAIERGLKDAYAQYQKLKQETGCSSNFEITFVTTHKSSDIRRCIVQSIEKLCMPDVRHIEVFCFNNARKSCTESGENDAVDGTVTQSQVDDTGGLLEVVDIECDVLSIENKLKQWFVDKSTDREHLQLQLRGPMPENDLISIKCDATERLFDVSEIPFSRCYQLTPNHGDGKKQPYLNARQNAKTMDGCPVAILKVIRRTPTESVCESVIFGTPAMICSSSCWQMEWDEIEINRHRFDALCRTLAHKQQCLICENNTFAGVGAPRPFFVIMASDNLGCLLVKPIASRGVLMTCRMPLKSQWDDVSEEVNNEIITAFENVELDPSYNPLLLNCDLTRALKKNLRAQAPRGANATSKKGSTTKGPRCGAKRDTGYQQQKPVLTGKAARFTAPRQDPVTAIRNRESTSDNEVSRTTDPYSDDTIRLPSRKSVTFPDFPNF